jgi:uncharacterized protein (DUF1684 family)
VRNGSNKLRAGFNIAILLLGFAALFGLPNIRVAKGAREDKNGYSAEIEKWRQSRQQEVTGENGWLSLIGLFWLKPGDNSFGSDPSKDIVLPANRCAKSAGVIKVDSGKVWISVNPSTDPPVTVEGKPTFAIAMELASDISGKPTVLNMGSLTLLIIKRGEKFGLRVRDKASPALAGFGGLQYYQTDPDWRVEARLEKHDPPRQIPIVNILGMTSDTPSPGTIVFTVKGQQYRLDAIGDAGTDQLFVLFKDRTNGKETYGAGRFLYTSPPAADGRLTIDFNKAFNPPCAFTQYATCPLPPRQNHLPIRIEAGEKKYGTGDH